MSFELIPFDDIKDLLGLKQPTIASYPDLAIIKLRLLPSFQEYTGREFEKKERTEEIFIHGPKVQMIPLKALPIESVSSVVISSNSYGTETVTSADFDITNYGLKLGWKIRNCKVSIVYTGGLTGTTDILKAAALYQLAYEFQSKDQIGAESVSNEGGSVYRPELGLLKETKRMLKSELHPLQVGSY